uniref:Acyl-CoA dehydrogenase medium chain n=1 Tax=Molossus molossus TaxID=27622 RepID=A0A7J8F5X3_MOLMO|nr:acyl-CoA dehydrogenase medium chain [Molossus molossus]
MEEKLIGIFYWLVLIRILRLLLVKPLLDLLWKQTPQEYRLEERN